MKSVFFFLLYLAFLSTFGQNYKLTTSDFISYEASDVNVGEYFVTFQNKNAKDQILKRIEVETIYKDDQKIYDRKLLKDIIYPKDDDGFSCSITKIEAHFILYKIDESEMVNSYAKEDIKRVLYLGDSQYFDQVEKEEVIESVFMQRGKATTEDHVYRAGDHLDRAGKQLKWSYLALLVTSEALLFLAINEAELNQIYGVAFVGSLSSIILFISGNNNIKNAGKELMRVE